MFPRIDYLHWIRGRPARADVDLGSSSLGIVPDDPGAVIDHVAAIDEPDGDAALEDLIAAEYGVPTEEVLVTAGATHANVLAMATAFDRADDPAALVETPGYEPLVATPRGLGARVERFHRRPESDYALDPDGIGERLDDDTALVTVSDRHNPSGRRADPGTLTEVARIAGEAGARLLVDEVYAPFAATAGDAEGFGAGSAAGLPGTAVTGSLTKFLGLGSLRVGWLIADAGFIERANEVAAHLPVVARTSRHLARRVVGGGDDLVADARERIRGNADRLADFAADRDDLTGVVRRGCTFAFLAHDRAGGDAVADAAREAGVLVVPGGFFDAPDRFRVSVAGDPDEVRAGLAVLGDVLDAL